MYEFSFISEEFDILSAQTENRDQFCCKSNFDSFFASQKQSLLLWEAIEFLAQ